MASDPKLRIKNIVDAYITGNPITEDDNVTAASVIHLYEGGPEGLKYLFFTANYDIVITYGEPQVRSRRDIVDVPEHYPERIPVTVTTTDKTGVTATKIQHKTGIAMRAAIEGSVHGADYTIKILEERAKYTRRGGILIWETPYIVQYEDA